MKLEDYIRQHKNDLEDYEPSEALWKRLERSMGQPPRRAVVKKMPVYKWLAVAACALIIAGSLIYMLKPTTTDKNIIAYQPEQPDSNRQRNELQTPVNQIDNADTQTTLSPALISKEKNTTQESESSPTVSDEELYHYTRLIEIKQEAMESLRKDAPELYEQFSADLEQLTTGYNELKKNLKKGINNSQLLEAMIINLKMQAELLNKQLEISKEYKKHHDEISNL